MNVKNRALLVVSIIILFLSVFDLHEGIKLHDKKIDEAIRAEDRLTNSITRDLIKYSLNPYRQAIDQLVKNNEALRQAFANRDRQLLYELSLPIYTDLHQENTYFHAMDFNLPDGTVFLRIQKPKFHGENISKSRTIVVDVHKTKEQRAGFDIGKHGAMFWVVQPIRQDGEYIGALEFGIEVKQLEKALQERLGRQVATVLKMNMWQKAVSIKHGFQTYGDYVLLTRGKTIFDQLPDNMDFSLKDQMVTINNKSNILHSCTTLTDHQGKAIGKILVLQDISDKLYSKKHFILRSILLTAVLFAISITVLFISFNYLIGRLEKYAADNQQAREKLQLAHDQLEERVTQRTAELAESNATLQKTIVTTRNSEKQLAYQGEFLHNIIESLTHPFYVINADSHEINLANKAAISLSGGEFSKGMTCFQMTHHLSEPCSGNEHPCPLKEIMKRKEPVVMEHCHYDTQGNEKHFEIHAYPILDKHDKVVQIIEYNIDITARKQAEEEKKKIWDQLVHAQKMEAVGVLAGGIAHDFNNILTAILGYSQILLMHLAKDDPSLKKIEAIHHAGEKAEVLTRQLLAFSRRQVVELKVTNLNSIIEGMAKMLERLIGENMVMKFSVTTGISNIYVDIGQVEQILMNLVINARDAMPDGGNLIIETGEIYLDEKYTRIHSGVEPGLYVMLVVADTGAGMSNEIREKIFDPFFTTKEKGKGTGLGLATVYGIVTQMKGHIYVYSEPDQGTTFKIYFPVTEEKVSEEQIQEIQSMPHGNETVMIVDDDSSIRGLLVDTLDPLGYKVIEAASGEEALEFYNNNDTHVDLVLSDVIMPGMNGRTLIEELKKIRPGIKTVLMSGYTDNVIVHHGIVDSGFVLISKPLLPVSLANQIRSILDGSTTATAKEGSNSAID